MVAGTVHCSHKRYTNNYLSQQMIFQYCDEDSGEPVQMYRLARAHLHRLKSRIVIVFGCYFYRTMIT